MAGLIDPNDPHDPIARQFVPDGRELEQTADERADPIADHPFSPVEGVVHRYPDRVLLKVVNACAVYCRFCFRREMVGPGRGGLAASALAAAFDYIESKPQIWEVILSGGDPLILSPRRIKDIVRRLAAVPHVQVIRVHTRIPVVAPERISAALVRALRTEKATFVVLHANHPRELTQDARAACARLIDAANSDAVAIGVVARRQRRHRNARHADARVRRLPHQALLPASCRSGARHLASAHDDRAGTGSDARPARPVFRAVPADLCARHPRRSRQNTDRPELCQRWGDSDGHADRRSYRQAAPVPAENREFF